MKATLMTWRAASVMVLSSTACLCSVRVGVCLTLWQLMYVDIQTVLLNKAEMQMVPTDLDPLTLQK